MNKCQTLSPNYVTRMIIRDETLSSIWHEVRKRSTGLKVLHVGSSTATYVATWDATVFALKDDIE